MVNILINHGAKLIQISKSTKFLLKKIDFFELRYPQKLQIPRIPMNYGILKTYRFHEFYGFFMSKIVHDGE